MKQKKTRFTIGYRLDDERLEKLELLAKKDGVSVHEKARQMMMAALDSRDEREDRLQLELAEARAQQELMFAQMQKMEHGTRETFVALFQRLNAATEEEARTFIEFVFGSQPTTTTH